MAQGLFITAADTGAGKTTLGCWLIPLLEARGLKLCIRKPVESGCLPGYLPKKQELYPQDAALLSQASRTRPPLELVCPYRYEPAVSPAHAARLAGDTMTLSDLVAACDASAEEFLLVEGAGGFYSPLTGNDRLNADLAQALGLPLLLVVEDRLGCLNHTLLTLEAAQKRQLRTLAIVFNAQVANDLDNAGELARCVDIPMFQIGAADDADSYRPTLERLAQLIVDSVAE